MIKTDSDFLLFAMHHYENPSVTSLDEFQDDIKKFVYILSLVNRYKSKKDVNERLLLNHIIVVFNVFGLGAVELLYYKIPETLWPIIETYMYFLQKIDKLRSHIDFETLTKLENL